MAIVIGVNLLTGFDSQVEVDFQQHLEQLVALRLVDSPKIGLEVWFGVDGPLGVEFITNPIDDASVQDILRLVHVDQLSPI